MDMFWPKMILTFVCFIIFLASSNGHTGKKIGLCPPDFIGIGSSCYFISKEKFNWLDAHFECKDKNGKLTEPTQIADRQLRRYLKTIGTENDDLWIGGSYEWNKHKWVWGYSGNEMKYNSFSKMNIRNLQYHCAILSAKLKYRWSARQCVEMNRFICEHKMYKTTTTGKQKIYHRWNATYPHKFANEVSLSANKMEGLLRNPRRKRPSNFFAERRMVHEKTSPTKCFPNKANVREQGINCNETNESIKIAGADHVDNRIDKPISHARNSSKNSEFDRMVEWKRQKEKRRKRIQLLRKWARGDTVPNTKPNLEDTTTTAQSHTLPPPSTETLLLPEYTLLQTTANNYNQIYQQNSVHAKGLANQEQGTPNEEKSHNVSTVSFQNDLEHWKEIVQRLALKEKRTLGHMKPLPSKSKGTTTVNPTSAQKNMREEEVVDGFSEKQLARLEFLRQIKEKLQKEKRNLGATVPAENNKSQSHNDTATKKNVKNEFENSTRSEDERKIRIQKLRDRIKNLTHEQRKRFHELRMQRRNHKKDQT